MPKSVVASVARPMNAPTAEPSIAKAGVPPAPPAASKAPLENTGHKIARLTQPSPEKAGAAAAAAAPAKAAPPPPPKHVSRALTLEFDAASDGKLPALPASSLVFPKGAPSCSPPLVDFNSLRSAAEEPHNHDSSLHAVEKSIEVHIICITYTIMIYCLAQERRMQILVDLLAKQQSQIAQLLNGTHPPPDDIVQTQRDIDQQLADQPKLDQVRNCSCFRTNYDHLFGQVLVDPIPEAVAPAALQEPGPETPAEPETPVEPDQGNGDAEEIPNIMHVATMTKSDKDKVRRICTPKLCSGKLEVPKDIFDLWQNEKGRGKLFDMWCKSGGVKAGHMLLCGSYMHIMKHILQVDLPWLAGSLHATG